MMLHKFLGAFAILALAVTSSQAGVLGSHLSYDGLVDILQDNSVSFVRDNDGDSAISAGDNVFGVMRIDATTNDGPLGSNDQLVGLFSFEVVSSTGAAGADPTVTIDSSRGTDPLAGTGLSIDELFGTSFGSSAAVAVLSSFPDSVDLTDLTPAGVLAAIGSYSVDAILGFLPGNEFGFADYLEVQGFRDFNDNGKIDFAEFPAQSPAGTFLANEVGGLSVLSGLGGSTFLPIDSVHADGSTVTQHHVGLSGTLFGRAGDTPSGWSITDKTTLAINAVPEPGAMTIWGAVLCFGLVANRRRKRSAK